MTLRFRVHVALALSALLAMPPAGAAPEQARLLQPYASVRRILGTPTAEGPVRSCDGLHLMYWRRPEAMLKAVIDPQGRAVAFGLLATRRPARAARTLAWPGLDTRFARLVPYARAPGAFPWFYNVGAQQFMYWEQQPPTPAAPDVRVFRGVVAIGFWAPVGDDFPFPEAEAATFRAYGEPEPSSGDGVLDNPTFDALIRWRRKAVPNAFMWVAGAANQPVGACAGEQLAQLDMFDPKKNLSGRPWRPGRGQ